jgi:uncharacterized phage protein gp47/JayE
MAGLTDSGIEIKTQADVLETIQNYQRIKISDKLSFAKTTPQGAMNPICAEQIEELWELAEECYHAYDIDNATDDRVVALAEVIGLSRRGASYGLVPQTLDLDASQSFAAGDLVFAVEGEPTNLWENRDAVASTTSGEYTAVFISQEPGAAAIALAGQLTVIPTPISGLNSGTNAADATAGLDIETIGALRIRIKQATARGGSRTTQAIRSAILNLDGVLSCDVFENTTSSVDAQGTPPHSIRVVVWDGSPGAASDDEIATAIWTRSATYSAGSETGTATDENLGDVTVNFNRATVVDYVVAVAIESESGVAADDVKAALVAADPYTVGLGVVLKKLAAAVFTVPGVDDYGTFTIDGAEDDLAEDQLTIYRLTTANITVTGDAS